MDTNNIKLSNALQGQPALANLVQSKTGIVAKEINLAKAPAEWDFRKDEEGRDLLILHIRDPLGAEAQSTFSPWELENEPQLRRRLHDLLGAAVLVGKWRGQLRQFFDDVRQWVQQNDDLAHFDESVHILSEERSGPYEVPILVIHTRGATARLEPVACWVVGARGRVDLVGEDDRAILVLDRNDKWMWVNQNVAFPSLQPLTKDLFLQLLHAVLR